MFFLFAKDRCDHDIGGGCARRHQLAGRENRAADAGNQAHEAILFSAFERSVRSVFFSSLSVSGRGKREMVILRVDLKK